MMPPNAKLFVTDLAKNIDELQEVFFNHLEDNLGELLPHLLMADYSRKLLSSQVDEDWIKIFLAELEGQFSIENDDEVSNVIAVSFIEHLPPPSENSPIFKRLGEKLKQQYQTVFDIYT